MPFFTRVRICIWREIRSKINLIQCNWNKEAVKMVLILRFNLCYKICVCVSIQTIIFKRLTHDSQILDWHILNDYNIQWWTDAVYH